MSKYPKPQSVADVAKVFDAESPGWAKKINLKDFSISRAKYCPMGQIFGDFSIARMEEWWGSETTQEQDFLADDKHKQAWLVEIEKRTKGMTFGEAIQLAMFEGKKVTHYSFADKFVYLYNGYLCWNNKQYVGNDWSPLFKNGWSEYTELEFKDLKAGQKFTFKSDEKPNKTIYTKADHREKYIAVSNDWKAILVQPLAVVELV